MAVAAICGDRVGDDPDGGDGSFDRRCEAWRVGWHAGFEFEVDDDALAVVGDLGGVAELGRLGEAALADRAGVTVAQRHPSGLRRRHLSGETDAGLGDDLGERIEEMIEIGEHPTEPLHRPVSDTASVDQDPFGLLNSGFCQVSEFAGDGEHLGLGLLGPASQLGADPVRGLTGISGAVIEHACVARPRRPGSVRPDRRSW